MGILSDQELEILRTNRKRREVRRKEVKEKEAAGEEYRNQRITSLRDFLYEMANDEATNFLDSGTVPFEGKWNRYGREDHLCGSPLYDGTVIPLSNLSELGYISSSGILSNTIYHRLVLVSGGVGMMREAIGVGPFPNTYTLYASDFLIPKGTMESTYPPSFREGHLEAFLTNLLEKEVTPDTLKDRIKEAVEAIRVKK